MWFVWYIVCPPPHLLEVEQGVRTRVRGVGCIVVTLLAACGGAARVPASAGFGPSPQLPPPNQTLIPTVNFAVANPFPAGKTPTPAPGLRVNPFAAGLDHPRFLYVLPNGDVLVAETNAPPKPDDAKGLRGRLFKYFQKKAGAATPSANRISLLRDVDGDGVAELRIPFLTNLHSPFGIVLVGRDLYVANSDALVRFPYADGDMAISAPPVTVAPLPAGTINHHWTKTVIASADGSKLYVSVGSNSNVAENGMENEVDRAAILEIDAKSGARSVYASGLRNAVGLAIEPRTGMIWAAVNERDEIGSDLVPDYITSVRDGAFYGWPYSYYGPHIDDRVKPQRPDLVARAIAPDYAVGAHTGSLGLAAAQGNKLPPRFAEGMFVGQHGSWNRNPRSGYKVIFVPFANGKPNGVPVDVLAGFLNKKGEAMGRPVGVAVDKRGALLVADDVANTIWRVSGETLPR